MLLELFGGPLDGTICEGPECMPLCLVATDVDQEPMYRRKSCESCLLGKVMVPYYFAGYQSQNMGEERQAFWEPPLSCQPSQEI